MASSRSDHGFARLARDFLAQHPEIAASWREVPSRLHGPRTDLVCAAGTPAEVWATLRPDTIAVGTGEAHEDFEPFGESLTPEQLAERAFAHFVALLTDRGQLARAIQRCAAAELRR